MKSKDWGAFFLLAIGIAAVWFWASGKAGAVWAAINGNTNAANPSSSSNTVNNGGSVNTQQYTPPTNLNQPLSGQPPIGQVPTPNTSQSPVTAALQTSSPAVTAVQPSLSNGFNLRQFVPPILVAGYASQPMFNEQYVPFVSNN